MNRKLAGSQELRDGVTVLPNDSFVDELRCLIDAVAVQVD